MYYVRYKTGGKQNRKLLDCMHTSNLTIAHDYTTYLYIFPSTHMYKYVNIYIHKQSKNVKILHVLFLTFF